MAADASAPCVTISSAVTLFTIWNKWILSLHKTELQVPKLFRCREISEIKIYFTFAENDPSSIRLTAVQEYLFFITWRIITSKLIYWWLFSMLLSMGNYRISSISSSRTIHHNYDYYIDVTLKRMSKNCLVISNSTNSHIHLITKPAQFCSFYLIKADRMWRHHKHLGLVR